ncbi:MAG: hypothetical protein DHS20C12_24740 [Pseudohongiella sp.]|nr:MAG: hypothetical protein DHS20C12_24740 [Pseudohongiella sp.]
MELVLYFAAVLGAGSFFYLVPCSLYFAFTSRSQLAALRLCWKLAAVSIIGIPLAGVGGVVLATLILHGQLYKSPNYHQIRDIVVSISISIACSVGIYFSAISLAFSILD